MKDLAFIAVSGPTTGTGLPVFKWSTSDFKDTQLHLGQPDEWNFSPILFKPRMTSIIEDTDDNIIDLGFEFYKMQSFTKTKGFLKNYSEYSALYELQVFDDFF